ncbi:hypothetical protein AaE_010465 [Aphanomyces astaci]|nr:hypothetical protein AaE_010465 [Aphanomyces astaci]
MQRYCAVCSFERDLRLIKTQRCSVHQVYLCTKAHVAHIGDQTMVASNLCPHIAWDCWDKFHRFYEPKGLFKANGKIDRSNDLYKAKKANKSEKPNKPSAKKALIL